MVDIPVLRTQRLILRAMVLADFPAFFALWQEPEVVRFIGEPRSEGESWGAFLRIAGSWALEGFGQWAITAAADDAFLGQAGFFRGKRGLGPDFDALPECGWVLTGAAQGVGLGREAVEAVHGWLDEQAFAGPTVAMIELGHDASFKLAAQLGYRALREVEDDGDRVMLLRRG